MRDCCVTSLRARSTKSVRRSLCLLPLSCEPLFPYSLDRRFVLYHISEWQGRKPCASYKDLKSRYLKNNTILACTSPIDNKPRHSLQPIQYGFLLIQSIQRDDVSSDHLLEEHPDQHHDGSIGSNSLPGLFICATSFPQKRLQSCLCCTLEGMMCYHVSVHTTKSLVVDAKRPR